jgi:hypothetical protein
LCAAPCVLRVRLHVAGCRAACCTFHAVSALLHADAACHIFRRMLHVLWCKQCDRRGPCVGRHATHRRRTSAHRVTRRAPPTIPTPRTLCGDPDQSSLADATLALVQAHRLRSCDPPLASTFFPSLPSPIPHPPFLRALLFDFPFV